MALRKRKHPLIPLVVWLGVALACATLALAFVLAQVAGQDKQLESAHAAGMELGQQMCLGLRSELERRPARKPASHPLGGLL